MDCGAYRRPGVADFLAHPRGYGQAHLALFYAY